MFFVQALTAYMGSVAFSLPIAARLERSHDLANGLLREIEPKILAGIREDVLSVGIDSR